MGNRQQGGSAVGKRRSTEGNGGTMDGVPSPKDGNSIIEDKLDKDQGKQKSKRNDSKTLKDREKDDKVKKTEEKRAKKNDKEGSVKNKEVELRDKSDSKKKNKKSGKSSDDAKLSRSSEPVTKLSPLKSSSDGKRPVSCSAAGTSTANGGLSAAQSSGGDSRVQLKIYRSYSELRDPHRSPCPSMTNCDPAIDIKVYRRRTMQAPTEPLSANDRAMSLPRSFGRSATMSDGICGSREFDGKMGARTLRPSDSADYRGSVGPAGGGWNTVDRRVTRSGSSLSTTSSLPPSSGYKVTKEDFPNADMTKKKLKQFESMFVRSLGQRYSTLAPEVQLSSLPIALRLNRAHHQTVSLLDYLSEDSGLPMDLLAAGAEYVMCIAPGLFTGMMHIRQDRNTDVGADGFDRRWLALARDVLTCSAAEAAGEIARMYEYQIALLMGETSIRLLAEHCADRVMDYAVGHMHRADRNTIVHGAVRGRQSNRGSTALPPLYTSVIIGLKELKWNVYEILTKPGLRKETLLVQPTLSLPDEDERCPCKLYTSDTSDPMLYGYRGQLVDWDYVRGVYRINTDDEAAFPEDVSWRYDDFHRLYSPYRRLIGATAVLQYCADVKSIGKVKLDEYLLRMAKGTSYVRDAIQPVYRPLEVVDVNFDGDMGIVDAPRNLLVPQTQRTVSATSNNVFASCEDVGTLNHESGMTVVPNRSNGGHLPPAINVQQY